MTGADFDEARERVFEDRLRTMVLAMADGLSCEIFLFGSRARGMARRSSDFDIGVRGLSPNDFHSLRSRIADAVDESDIPHGVDVVDFDRAGEPFRTIAEKDKVTWKSA